MYQVDDLDLKIITHLQEDGRRSFREIADDVGVTERTVRMRVTQLRERGIVQVVGVVNPVQVGLQTSAIVQLAIREESLNESIELLRALPEVRFITLTSGEYQVLFQVIQRSHEQMVDFLKTRLKSLPGIRASNFMLQLEVLKSDFKLVRNDRIMG